MIRDLSVQPRGILLWRGMLQWFGGVGIIFIALGILPLLRIGGMQLYTMESSDKSDKSLPKTSQIIGMIMIIYVIFTIICTVLLYLSELDWFEALTYTLSTIPTGGFAHGRHRGYGSIRSFSAGRDRRDKRIQRLRQLLLLRINQLHQLRYE